MSDNAQNSERARLENEALRQRSATLEIEKDTHGAQASAQWRLLVDEAPIGIATVGLDKRFLTCNAAFCAFLGYSEQELQQKTIAEITHPEDVALGMADMGAIVAGKKKAARLEKRYVRKDGTVVWGEVSIHLVRNGLGQPLYFMPFVLDTTERKRAVELLRDNELKYRALFEAAEGAILLFADGRWIDCNAKALRVFGCTREEILGAHPSRFSPPTQPDGRPSGPEAARLITLAYTTGPQSFQWEHCQADGTPFTAEVSLHRVDLGGKPHIQAIVRDISNRMRTEISLKENVALLQSAGRLSRFGGWSVDVATNRCAWSDEVARIHEEPSGYSPLVEDGINYYAPQWRDRITKVFSACVQDGTPYDEELEIITAKGKRVWVRTCADAVRDEAGKIVKVHGGFQDISERKQIEAAAKVSENLFRNVFEAANVGKSITSPGGKISVNQCFADLLGYERHELEGKTWQELTLPEDIELTQAKVAQLLSGEMDATRFTKRFLHKNGSVVWVDVSVALCRDAGGQPLHFITTLIDITERKRAEQALRESKLLFESVVEHVPLMIFLKEPQDLRFVVFNKAGEELLGYDRKDLLGKNNLNLFPPEQAAHFMAKDREVLTEGALVDIPEESITTAKKGLRTLHTRKVCLKGPDGTAQYLLGISEDITERKRAEAEREKLEEQLRASQRLDSIGSLVGGIAHDFNNLLSIILSYTSFAIAKTSGKLRDELLEVERAGERAAALTKQLLAFSSRQVLEPEPTKLNFIVSDIEKMLRRILGEDIEFEMALWPNLGSTLADPGKLEQVLMNLVVNARDAMPKGGRLRLETSHLELDESASSIVPSIEPGRYVCLAVSDTGCGMDKETMARIFEPFFTTKAPGKGTGLGLPTVYGIVKQSGGGIAVTSATGQGTTFRVYLKHLSEAESEAWPKRGVRSTTKTRESEPPSLVPAKGPPLSPQWQEEAELRNSQKLEAIGGLAAGIAHEINTPAQYVSDSLHFLMEACGAQKQLAASHRSAAAALSEAGGHETLVTAMRRLEEEIDLDYLEENVPQSLTLCRDGLARISSIVEALKSFSQKGTHDRAPADLNAALQTTLTVCRNEYKYVAEIETDLGELPLVSCNLGDVNQVFLSLIVNAAQAVADAAQPRGGMGKIRVTSRTDGRNVRINISDTGAGIPEAIRGRVFEPFFTTKPVGRGVGQSLAIARSIVEEQHGGRLTFESTVGMGTTFTLELPSEPLEGPGAQSLLPGQGAEKGRPRILVIDDEPPLGVAMGRVLRHEFEVVLATGGAQALDLVASDQSFDVLLCDLHMPEMSGMDFHDRLLARWPQLASRIVFMSGGASTARAQDFLGSVHRPWLSKPVEPAALVSTVRSMLADKRSP